MTEQNEEITKQTLWNHIWSQISKHQKLDLYNYFGIAIREFSLFQFEKTELQTPYRCDDNIMELLCSRLLLTIGETIPKDRNFELRMVNPIIRNYTSRVRETILYEFHVYYHDSKDYVGVLEISNKGCISFDFDDYPDLQQWNKQQDTNTQNDQERIRGVPPAKDIGKMFDGFENMVFKN